LSWTEGLDELVTDSGKPNTEVQADDALTAVVPTIKKRPLLYVPESPI